MRISAVFPLACDCPQPVPMLLTLSVHPGLRGRQLTPEWIRTDPGVEVRRYLDGFGYEHARNNPPRIGRVLIARGRDATDGAMVNSFGPAQLVEFRVVTVACARSETDEGSGPC
jgi:hypothetical protein